MFLSKQILEKIEHEMFGDTKCDQCGKYTNRQGYVYMYMQGKSCEYNMCEDCLDKIKNKLRRLA